MKYREIILKQLDKQPFFNKKAIYQLSEQFGLKSATIDAYINQSLKHRELFSLKNGLYVSADFYDKNKGDVSYLFYLANIIRSPSYVSSWTALQYYNLTTEIIHPIISITTKVTRDYQTKIAGFFYRSMREDLFSDFSLVKGKPDSPTGGFDFFIASPAKAFFDLIYFKTRWFRGLNFDQIKKMIIDLRVDFEEMDQKEQEKFYTLVKNYTNYE